MPTESANSTTRDSEAYTKGIVLHHSETRRQIAFPFLLGVLLIVAIFLAFGLPDDPVWRIRAEVVADWLFSVLCLLPLLLCQLPIFVVLVVGIYGMYRFHERVEPPLQRLEIVGEQAIAWLENLDEIVTSRVEAVNEKLDPIKDVMTIFDPIESTAEKEQEDESGRETNFGD